MPFCEDHVLTREEQRRFSEVTYYGDLVFGPSGVERVSDSFTSEFGISETTLEERIERSIAETLDMLKCENSPEFSAILEFLLSRLRSAQRIEITPRTAGAGASASEPAGGFIQGDASSDNDETPRAGTGSND